MFKVYVGFNWLKLVEEVEGAYTVEGVEEVEGV
jgi:hypothetical protein